MIKVIDFIKGSEVRGSIIQLEEKSFRAVTGTTSKSYKTERGARAFMEKNGYIEVEAVKVDTVGNVVEVVELGEATIIEVEDSLLGVSNEVLATTGVVIDIQEYLNRKTDKYDFIESVNEKLKDSKIIVIDASYDSKSEAVLDNGVKIGATVKAHSERVFIGTTTVIGIKRHFNTDRYVAVLSNGIECFADGDNLVVIDETAVEVADAPVYYRDMETIKVYHKGKYINVKQLPDGAFIEVCPRCGGSGTAAQYLYHDNGFCYKCMGTGRGKMVNITPMTEEEIIADLISRYEARCKKRNALPMPDFMLEDRRSRAESNEQFIEWLLQMQ